MQEDHLEARARERTHGKSRIALHYPVTRKPSEGRRLVRPLGRRGGGVTPVAQREQLRSMHAQREA